MSLRDLFQGAVRELRARNITFAVAGGFAADLYRREPRLTMDVDLAILACPDEAAVAVIEAIGLQAGVAREADLAGGPLFAIRQKNTRPCMVIGRLAAGTTGEGVDLLLPVIPWAAGAVRRAQGNLVDFGFGPVPALTMEDVMLSKLYALNAAHLRAKDLDDLQSIAEAGHEVDMAYLAGEMRRLNITVPRKAEVFLPDAILKVSRDIKRHPHAVPPAGSGDSC